MTRYFGVKCRERDTPIPIAVYRPDERRTDAYTVPQESILCLECGSIHRYGLEDSLMFDGVDGLTLFRRA
jgi:hypothetical protein